MCGILCSVSHYLDSYDDDTSVNGIDQSNAFVQICRRLREANLARGPDAQQAFHVNYPAFEPSANNGPVIAESPCLSDHLKYPSSPITLNFYASELRLRGNSDVIQPHKDEGNGNILCWNGEIFEGMQILPEENDGVKLFHSLHSIKTAEEIHDLFGGIEGPYAFVFYHAESHCLYFARDPLGRRSLLIHRPTLSSPYLLLSSVSAGLDPGYNFQEISTDFIYCLNIDALWTTGNITEGYSSIIKTLPRQTPDRRLPYTKPRQVNTQLPPDEIPTVSSLDNIPDYLSPIVDGLFDELDKSVMLRVRDIPCRDSGQARVAVLFSGGIDSTIVAYFAHRHVPLDEPIDLLNVAFENPRKIKLQSEGNAGGLPKRRKKAQSQAIPDGFIDVSYMVPDRATGLKETEELRRLCPGRTWNFVEIDVLYQESQEHRQLVQSLMLPSRTVMDLSLALALYFASRGRGQVRSSPELEAVAYESRARVLLNGLGSDELFGGYGRHRTAYSTGGWPAVIEELQLEIDRIPMRNLGRDDRVISSHGKETRHPFLSLDVVSFIASLPAQYKMDPRLTVGFGDKILLRMLARRVGLIEASERKKRAMQFGSHSARMDGERRGDLEINN